MNEKETSTEMSHVYLYDYLKKNVNLADFLETELGADLVWRELDVSAACICPMPHHKDSKPSFCIRYVEEDDIWIYQCWGCGSKGTILDLRMDYYGFNNVTEAVDFLCEKFDFKDVGEMVVESLKNLKKKINVQNKLNCQNIVISDRCRILLRRDYGVYKGFVSDVYKQLNVALDEEDSEKVEELDNLVFNKSEEKQNVVR